LAAQENHNSVGLCRNESKEKDIFRAAIVAFENGVSERAAGMELDLLVPCSNKVVDDV